jgi:serine/threonine protein kinase
MAETIGRYQPLESLGTGTLGELHRARDLERGRTVALRVLAQSLAQDPDRLTALLKDVDRASAASHPVLPAFYEDGQDGQVTFLASEYVSGERLAEVVHGTPLNARRALDFAVQIADGLAAAHAAGLEHGALSTQAILITMKGAVKILDVGMLAWTATPEHERCDDYVGLGEVVFEMLTGHPIKRGWPAELKHDHIPEAVRPILKRLLAERGTEVYPSMAVASAALRDALLRLTATPAPVAAVPEPESAPIITTDTKVRPVVWMALAVAVVLALVWYFFPR